jgi:glucosamine--fructose-6-phosphate aminotransferase (isomerizing)
MCGIVGYVGKKQAAPIILDGLRHLEYRGYDSAGITILKDGSLDTRKQKGKIVEGLAKLLENRRPQGSLGVGHTRWATHGEPSDRNSHPHLDASGKISIVHNGVIENFESLRDKLKERGHEFKSETDTEVLAHLIGEYYAKNDGSPDGVHPLTNAVMNALREVIGTYGIAVICSDFPGVLVGARRGSPLIVGVGKDEHFLASDASAIVAHTRQVAYLNDYDVVTVEADRFDVKNLGSDAAHVQISQIEYTDVASELGRFPHFLL